MRRTCREIHGVVLDSAGRMFGFGDAFMSWPMKKLGHGGWL